MVSWFGTLGSSLGRSLGQVGGSMASLTGHNSNVTKAVLRKGDEQGPEDVPESKTKEVEDVQSTFKSGNERKESDTLRDKEKVLPQTTSLKELPKEQQAGSDADSELMSSLNQNNMLLKKT